MKCTMMLLGHGFAHNCDVDASEATPQIAEIQAVGSALPLLLGAPWLRFGVRSPKRSVKINRSTAAVQRVDQRVDRRVSLMPNASAPFTLTGLLEPLVNFIDTTGHFAHTDSRTVLRLFHSGNSMAVTMTRH